VPLETAARAIPRPGTHSCRSQIPASRHIPPAYEFSRE
jgi:hypothetical protein